jgi:hypothetical protein
MQSLMDSKVVLPLAAPTAQRARQAQVGVESRLRWCGATPLSQERLEPPVNCHSYNSVKPVDGV